MVAVLRRPKYEHVTDRKVELDEVAFILNHYRVLHVAVHLVNMEVNLRRRPPLAVPHWTPDGYGCSRDGDPI